MTIPSFVSFFLASRTRFAASTCWGDCHDCRAVHQLALRLAKKLLNRPLTRSRSEDAFHGIRWKMKQSVLDHVRVTVDPEDPILPEHIQSTLIALTAEWAEHFLADPQHSKSPFRSVASFAQIRIASLSPRMYISSGSSHS